MSRKQSRERSYKDKGKVLKSLSITLFLHYPISAERSYRLPPEVCSNISAAAQQRCFGWVPQLATLHNGKFLYLMLSHVSSSPGSSPGGRGEKQMLLKAPRLEEGIDSNALKNRTSSKIS